MRARAGRGAGRTFARCGARRLRAWAVPKGTFSVSYQAAPAGGARVSAQWLGQNEHRFTSDDHIRGGLRRNEVYKAAGLDLSMGGQHVKFFAAALDEWVLDRYDVGAVKLSGGYPGYKGVRLIPM